MTFKHLQPPGWAPAKGYAHGIAARGTQIYVGGQIGWNAQQQFETDDFIAQVHQALRNIADVLRETRGGFNFGKVVLEGIGEDKGGHAEVDFQNENLCATVNGEILATTPDLICLVDTETFTPVPTDALKYGKRVLVVGLPCYHLWRTEKGIELVGPRYFGLNTDYIPVEERCKG